VINEQNIELQISPKKQQIHSAHRVKKFISPDKSKFLDKKETEKNMVKNSDTEIMTERRRTNGIEEW
jgi:hypothetical protein